MTILEKLAEIVGAKVEQIVQISVGISGTASIDVNASRTWDLKTSDYKSSYDEEIEGWDFDKINDIMVTIFYKNNKGKLKEYELYIDNSYRYLRYIFENYVGSSLLFKE